MKYRVGDLVWLASAWDELGPCGPPAIVLDAYIDEPRIFLYNERANKEWLEDKDKSVGEVYDIFYNGRIEIAVLDEWLKPLNYGGKKREEGDPSSHDD